MSTPILALDLGVKRTGLALNPTGSVILELPTLVHADTEAFLVRIAEVITLHQPRTVVVGRPRDIGGLVATMLEQLKHLPGCPPIEFVDETLSTKEAERQLAAEGAPGSDSDARAARLILEQYLETSHIPSSKGEV